MSTLFGKKIRDGAGRRDAPAPTARRRGALGAFSLVELLVVVAIIALLAALLMPSLSSALDQARRTVCAQNLRTLHLGAMHFHADYDQLPPNWVGSLADRIERGAPWTRNDVWFSMLRDWGYLDGSQALTGENRRRSDKMDALWCPSWRPLAKATSASRYQWGAGYAMNARIQPPWRIRLSAVSRPESRYLYGDLSIEHYMVGQSHEQWLPGHIGLWHGNGANLVFLDGHVQRVKEEEIGILPLGALNPQNTPHFPW